MSKLVIVVPAGRRRCGRAVLLGSSGTVRLDPVRVLATASESMAARNGNADRDWRRPFGHSPTGTYLVSGSLPPGVMPKPRKRWWRFGKFGALILSPVGGNALEASKAGRTRFLLHGGQTDSIGRLRPTFGGFRISDRHLRELLGAVNEAYADGDPVASVEVAETDAPSWLDWGRWDEAGYLRPAVDGPEAPSDATVTKGGISVTRAALIALGFGIVGRGLRGQRGARKPAVVAEVDRRDFVGLAFLTVGALGTSGCTPADDPTPDPEACTVNPCRPAGVDGGLDGSRDGGLDGARDGGHGDDGGGADGGYDGGYPDGGRPDGSTGAGTFSGTTSGDTSPTGNTSSDTGPNTGPPPGTDTGPTGTPIGTDTTPIGTDTTPIGTDTSPTGTDTSPTGTDTSPTGTDTGPIGTDTGTTFETGTG